MDGTASGINSFDTMEADIGEPIEERELISEIEGENHGLFQLSKDILSYHC